MPSSCVGKIRPRQALTTIVLTLSFAVLPSQQAAALITGGEGNKPIADPGWPKGASVLFNHPGRIAWWEGPPFGGGQWHAECRGDAKAFNKVLADFSKLDLKSRRVVIHDGVGHSFWLNPNREQAKQDAARIDWVFIVWQPANWERLHKLPADLNPTEADDAGKGPPAQIDVYSGGNIRWSDVQVPQGLEIIDERLVAHGFAMSDGVVLEGKVVDLATGRPITARVSLQRVEPQAKGGYLYPEATRSLANEHGHWVLRNVPAGWHRVVIEAEGFAARVVGYGQFDNQPHWHAYDSGLSRAATISGVVTDDTGHPLADVQVRFADVAVDRGGRYESPVETATRTDAAGRFRAEHLPAGRATIWLNKFGYCRPGLGLPIQAPANDVVLKMQKAARARVTVTFSGAKRSGEYLVQIEPEGGATVGSWGGSGQIDEKNQILFTDIPPGRYRVSGQPNPSSAREKTKPLTVDLIGGRVAELTLEAR